MHNVVFGPEAVFAETAAKFISPGAQGIAYDPLSVYASDAGAQTFDGANHGIGFLNTGLLDADPQPTAIVYSNDLMAVAGMSAAFSRGLRVPDDISIVGWDDITVSQYLHPALSTITQHPFDDGRVAAKLLLEAIEGRQFDEPVWMPNPRFRPRESSGPAAR